MEFESLSAEERAERYRAKAREQIELAGTADTSEIRAGCLELAGMWMRLAEAAAHGEAEVEARRKRSDAADDSLSA